MSCTCAYGYCLTHIARPSKIAGGRRLDHGTGMTRYGKGRKTEATERMAAEINGVAPIERPAVFDEIEDFERWKAAGQKPESKPRRGVTPAVVRHLGRSRLITGLQLHDDDVRFEDDHHPRPTTCSRS